MRRCGRLLLILAGLAVTSAIQGALVQPEEHYAQIGRRLARYLPSEHLRRLPLNNKLSALAWTNYLSSASGLDPDHLYFLKSDIDRFRAHVHSLDDELVEGDLGFAYDVFDVFKQRVENRCKYVDQVLAEGFDLSKTEHYQWRREKAAWSASSREWNDLWHRKVKNEFVRRVVADEESVASTNTAAHIEYVHKRYDRFRTGVMDSDAEWVLEKYLTAFTHAYDPHSTYMSPSRVEDFNIEMKLSLVGIGALLQTEEGAAKVLRIIPGGPADKDGRLQSGDRIVAVAQDKENSVDVMHWSLSKIVDLIRGKKGTRVVLTVIPAADPTGSHTKTIDIVRGEVRLEDQAASSVIRTVTGFDGIPRKLGIIDLPAFYANMKVREKSSPDFKSSSYDVNKILITLRRAGVDGIVLDLRNNGGGSLLEAVQMVGLFIRRGPVVKVRERLSPRILADDDPRVGYAGPLVVLVSRLSASASEIVAAALQDYGRAVVIGDSKTHGKGTVQSILELGSARMGALKLTTSVYYRISGGSTQLRGVASDIVLPSPFDSMEFGEDYLPNAIPWDMERRAIYTSVPDLTYVIPKLRKRSEARREKNPDFATYAELLKRIQALNKIEALPLNVDERRALAKSEQELLELRDKLVFKKRLAPGETKPQDESPDLVLSEGLNILADLISLQRSHAQFVPPSPPSTRKGLAQSISDWFKQKL